MQLQWAYYLPNSSFHPIIKSQKPDGSQLAFLNIGSYILQVFLIDSVLVGASAFTGENTRAESSLKESSHATFVHLASGEAYRIVNVRPRNWRTSLCWACVSSRCLGIKFCQRIVDAWGWQPGSLRLSNRLYFTKRKDQTCLHAELHGSQKSTRWRTVNSGIPQAMPWEERKSAP